MGAGAFFMSSLSDQIKREKEASFDALQQKRLLWDNAEKLFHNQLNDLVSQESSSQVFDPKLSTLTIERAYRVMAQLATGKVKGISKNLIFIIPCGINPKNTIIFKFIIFFKKNI